MDQSIPTRLMVLMFTDVAGSTDLKSRLGTGPYAALASQHDSIFRGIVEPIEGAEVLKDVGDGFMARFELASGAVRAALLFQHALAGLRTPVEGCPFRVRLGIHLGEVSELGVDIYGKSKVVGLAADLSARVMSLALPGQILLTRAAFDDARQYLREHPPVGDGASPELRWIAHGEYLFKGADDPMEVFEVGAVGVAPFQAPPDSEKARRAVRAGEEDLLGWRPAAGLVVPMRPGWFLDKKLGEGGFGEVWLATQRKTSERRVFKFCFDADRLRSLRRELTLFRLIRETLGDRQDITRLHDVQLDKPPYFLESEHSALGNLGEWIDGRGGCAALPLSARLDLVARIADAVAAAHSVGVLHKDLKPSNVLMREDASVPAGARPLLADFGIGTLTDMARLADKNITVAGFTVRTLTDNSGGRTGTHMYAPPELEAGVRFSVQGDVYALGVILYQMSVGDLRKPLAGGWQRGVPDEALRELIGDATDGDPQQRLRSAEELAGRIRSLDRERERLRAQRRKRKVVRSGIAAGIVAVLLSAWAIREVVLRTETASVNAKRLDERQRADDSSRAARIAARHLVGGARGEERPPSAEQLDEKERSLRRDLAAEPGLLTKSLRELAELRKRGGDLGRAASLYAEIIPIQRELHDPADLSKSLVSYGDVLSRQAKEAADAEARDQLIEQALSLDAEAVQLAISIGDEKLRCWHELSYLNIYKSRDASTVISRLGETLGRLKEIPARSAEQCYRAIGVACSAARDKALHEPAEAVILGFWELMKDARDQSAEIRANSAAMIVDFYVTWKRRYSSGGAIIFDERIATWTYRATEAKAEAERDAARAAPDKGG